MPKNITELVVFISSPEDLAAERQVIKSAIEETNPVLRDTLGVQLRSIVWTDDVVPGIGSNAQAVVSSQVDNKYDIYIGLLGSRFGTPTAHAGSGTEEEFDTACQKYIDAPENIRILFYFKTSVENLFRCDVGQIERVMKFRGKLCEKGVLYSEFTDKDALLRIIKEHLRRLITEQWGGTGWKVLSPVQQTTALTASAKIPLSIDCREAQEIEAALDNQDLTEEEDEDDAAGILDAVVAGEAALQTAITSLGNITALMGTLTDRTTQRAVEINDAVAKKNASNMKAAVDGSAADLSEFARGLRKEIVSFNASFSEALAAVESTLRLYFAEAVADPAQIRNLPIQLGSMIEGMRSGRQSTDFLRDTISSLPGFTSKFKKAKREAARLLADLSAAITISLEKAETIQENANRMLSDRHRVEGTSNQ